MVSAILVACGGKDGEAGVGSGSTAANAGGPSVSPTEGAAKSLAYDLEGFKKCGEEFSKNITLSTKTHVAWGQIAGNKLVYLFNQEKGAVIKPRNDFFGSDPMPGSGNVVYCKPVASDNNDLAVFDASLAAIKQHINGKDGKSVLSSEQIRLHTNRLRQTMHALIDSEAKILDAFDVIAAYEKMRGGALFLNKETKLNKEPKEGFQNEGYGDEGRDIDRAVLAIQQGIHDTAYTPANLARYKIVLSGKKFASHEWYPGKIKNNVVADPFKVNKVKINASMDKNLDIRTAFSETTRDDDIITRQPTGYYLAAGDIAKVTVPTSMVGKGFAIQVGASVHDKSKKSKIARPFRVVNKFPINSNVTEIANPNGGGIYIDVPYLASAGKEVTIEIQNAIPAPFFSFTAIKKMSNKDWQDVRNHPAPWADFMSEKFMMTLPTSWIYKYDDPVALMEDWDKRMDIVNRYTGYNIKTKNNQTLYLTVDTDLNSDAGGIGYPTGNDTYNPAEPTDGNHKAFFLVPGPEKFKDSKTLFHELGHAQLFDAFGGEGETTVNMLFVAVKTQLYGDDIEEAFGLSRAVEYKHISRDLAAANWMVTKKFRDGKPMEYAESSYQHRGHAKYVDIAMLFGWKTIEAYYAQENAVHRGEAVAAGAAWGLKDKEDDARILKWSIAAGKDLTPLMHFWGIHPSSAGAATLSSAISAAGLKPSKAVHDRLKAYEALIPADNNSFKAHAVKFLAVKSAEDIKGDITSKDNNYMNWYTVQLSEYGSIQGEATQVAFKKIFGTYFSSAMPSQ